MDQVPASPGVSSWTSGKSPSATLFISEAPRPHLQNGVNEIYSGVCCKPL